MCINAPLHVHLLVKSAISTEKCDFVVGLITHFVPFATSWRGSSSSLRLHAMLRSVNTFLGSEQGSQLKGTHQSEYAFQSSFCPNREGCYFVLFPGSLHRQARNADRFFKGKASAHDSLQPVRHSPAQSPHNPSRLHPTITLWIYQRKSPSFLKIQHSTYSKKLTPHIQLSKVAPRSTVV